MAKNVQQYIGQHEVMEVKFHHHKSVLGPTQCWLNPVYTSTTCFSNINFDTLPSVSTSHK